MIMELDDARLRNAHRFVGDPVTYSLGDYHRSQEVYGRRRTCEEQDVEGGSKNPWKNLR